MPAWPGTGQKSLVGAAAVASVPGATVSGRRQRRPRARPAAAETGIGTRLLLAPDTAVTCPPSRDHEFSLERGFATRKRSSSRGSQPGEPACAGAVGARHRAEGARGARGASDRERCITEQVGALRKLLDDQAETHRQGLAQMREVGAVASPTTASMNALLAERDAQLRATAERDMALAAREAPLKPRSPRPQRRVPQSCSPTSIAAFERQLQQQGALAREDGASASSACSPSSNGSPTRRRARVEVARRTQAAQAEIESCALGRRRARRPR